MSLLRKLLISAPLSVLLLPAPADAAARCGVPQAKAVYETADVQVYAKRAKLIACLRATGRARHLSR